MEEKDVISRQKYRLEDSVGIRKKMKKSGLYACTCTSVGVVL